jgi:hypothetical protein
MLGLVMAASALATTSGFGREWTDITGQYRREAEFVRRDGGRVWLIDAAGHHLSVELRRLSLADQALVAELESGNAGRRAAKRPMAIETLAYRTAARELGLSVPDSQAESTGRPFRLADWCSSGHCYVHPHPHPHPPHPPCPPLPVPSKRIYHGCWSTWHLVTQVPKTVGGTGSYLITLGGTVVRHLVLLEYVGPSNSSLHYRAVGPLPAGAIPNWRFSNVSHDCCWYAVEWSMNGTDWYFYEWCRVKLPQ